MPQIAKSSVEVLRHNNVSTVIPEAQGCCGIPALAAGDGKTFNSLVAYHIDRFKTQDFDYLVAACATCISTIKKLWPSLYRGKDKTHAHFLETLAAKSMDISQFLVDVMQVRPSNNTDSSFQQEPVTCHDPCHLKKSLDVFTQPRQILKASGYPVTEMAGADRCCGMGGSFNLLHYDLSSRIGSVKKIHIINTGCKIVATGCPACIMQLSDMLSRSKSRIKVKHPIELYAQTLKHP
jgi:glycolate oxidase iron-sulfur subunit